MWYFDSMSRVSEHDVCAKIAGLSVSDPATDPHKINSTWMEYLEGEGVENHNIPISNQTDYGEAQS